MNKVNINEIMVDLDGVLCNLDKRYKELFGISPEQGRLNPKTRHLFDIFVQHNNFATLEPMPDF